MHRAVAGETRSQVNVLPNFYLIIVRYRYLMSNGSVFEAQGCHIFLCFLLNWVVPISAFIDTMVYIILGRRATAVAARRPTKA